MQILGLLGLYFDAVVVFVKKTSLLFRLAPYCVCGLFMGVVSWDIIDKSHRYKAFKLLSSKFFACLSFSKS